MAVSVLVISKRDEDQKFANRIAKANKFSFQSINEIDKIREFLIDHPQTVVFWDADGPESDSELVERQEAIGKLLGEVSHPLRVFAITDGSLSANPYLVEVSTYGHHAFRRYDEAAFQFYSRIIVCAFLSYPFGVTRYFPEGVASQKITISQLKHKNPAVQAIQNTLEKKGIIPRLSTLAARATDELLMNSIFAAPEFAQAKAGGLSRDKMLPTNPEYKLAKPIEIEVVVNDAFVGIGVIDQYGTFSRKTVLPSLEKDYQKAGYYKFSGGGDKPQGLGLNNIIESGISLLFVYRPSVQTEVMIFFPKAANYKEFRKGFQIVSFLTTT